jgi:tetratricopeptide (TPR) repeat protein
MLIKRHQVIPYVKKSLSEMAVEANVEAKEQIETSVYKGIFAFRAQKLLKENDILLMQEKYLEVVENSDRIAAIVERENELGMMDQIYTLLSWIENIIKSGNENFADTTQIKARAFAVEEILNVGNLYLSTSTLLEIIKDFREMQEDNFYEWSRYMTVELNDRMDDLLELYNEFPKHFFDFHENPIHILTSYVEDILDAVSHADLWELEEEIRKFYILYFQVERFLREEKQEVSSKVSGAVSSDRMKDLLMKLKEIHEEETGVELGPVLKETISDLEDYEETDLSLEQLEEEIEELEPVDDEDILEVEEMHPEEGLHHEFDFDDIPGPMDKPAELAITELEKRRLSIEVAEVLEKLDKEKGEVRRKGKKRLVVREVPGTHRIKSHVKRKAKNGGKKRLPSYVAFGERKQVVEEDDTMVEQVEVIRKVRKAKKKDGAAVVKGEVTSPVEVVPHADDEEHEEVDIDQLMQRLDAVAFMHYINKDYQKAIEYYDQIIIINPKYKDAYEKRDKCYERVFKDMKSQFVQVIKRKRKAKGRPKRKAKKKDT